MRKTRTFIAMAAIAACCISGCKQMAGGASTSSPTIGAGSQQRSAGLRMVHDPGQVTGVAPTSCHTQPGPLPDPTCTPGAVDPSVTQANIASTICRSGYTSRVRPAVTETDRLKAQMYRAYGIPDGTPAELDHLVLRVRLPAELDHLVPLELGGANDVTNLWPEVGRQPNPKDEVENDLRKAVCSGKVALAAAQKAIASNWLTAEKVLGLT